MRVVANAFLALAASLCLAVPGAQAQQPAAPAMLTSADWAAFKSGDPLDLNPVCRAFDARARLGTAGVPYERCVRADGSTIYTHPLNICARVRPSYSPILIVSSGRWRCMPDAYKPVTGEVSLDLPYPGIGQVDLGPDVAAMKKHFDANFVHPVPRQLLTSDYAVTLVRRDGSTGSLGARDPFIGQFSFVLFGAGAMALQRSADRLDAVFAQLLRATPDLATHAQKVAVLGESPDGTEDIAYAALLASRGYVVLVAGKERPRVEQAMLSNNISFGNQFAIVDPHGFLRAYGDALTALDPSTFPLPMERTDPLAWLSFAHANAVTRSLPRSLDFERFVVETEGAGRIAATTASLPDGFSIGPSFKAAVRKLLAQQAASGREAGALLRLDTQGRLTVDTSGTDNLATRTYIARDTEAVLEALAQGKRKCEGLYCWRDMSGSSPVVGNIHTHPGEAPFSSGDIRHGLAEGRIHVVALPSERLFVMVPTRDALKGQFASRVDSTRFSARAAQYLRAGSCKGDQVLSMAQHGAAVAYPAGWVTYEGNLEGLRRLAPPPGTEAELQRPVLRMFDASGQLVSPVDRLRLAVMVRLAKMPPEDIAGDIGPLDVFGSGLTERTAKLLGEREFTPELVEWWFTIRWDDAREPLDVTAIGAPHIWKRVSPNVAWAMWPCDDSTSWVRRTYASAVTSHEDVELGLISVVQRTRTASPRADHDCAGWELMRRSPAAPDGSYTMSYYCENGQLQVSDVRGERDNWRPNGRWR